MKRGLAIAIENLNDNRERWIERHDKIRCR